MSHKLVKVWMPEIALLNIKKKQTRMEQELKHLTGKKKNVPLTKIMIAISQRPIELEDHELKRLIKKRSFSI